MDIRGAMKEQYHAGLGMLADCVEKCPEDMWTAGTYPRFFWSIAWHAVFSTHVNLVQNEDTYEPWPDRPVGMHEKMFLEPAWLEPFELPEGAEHFTKQQTLDYIAHVDSLVDPTVDGLDLNTPESGYRWYNDFPKLNHQLMNLGHLQSHTGQLKELLMARGIETVWLSGRD